MASPVSGPCKPGGVAVTPSESAPWGYESAVLTPGSLPSASEMQQNEPTVTYRTIVADPPWEYGKSNGFSWREGRPSGERTAMLSYPTMTVDEIAALPVTDLAKDDAFLFLWTTHRYVWDAPRIAGRWGFKTSKLLTWCKPPTGFTLGGTFGNSSEFVLFARRGTPKPTSKVPRDWWEWSRGQHSAKPEAFLDIVEQVCSGPYLEMFARRNRLGWDTWGNECFEHVEVPT